MNTQEELDDLTERYLADALSEKELLEYRKSLENNPDLKIRTEKIRQVNELLFMEGLKGELKQIQKAEGNYLFRQQLKQYGKWLGGILVAGSATALVWMWSGTEKMDQTSAGIEKETSSDSLIVSLEKEGKRSNTSLIVSPDLSPANGNREENIQDHALLLSTIPVTPLMTSEIEQNQDTIHQKMSQEYTGKTEPCKESIQGIFESASACENKNNGSILLKSISGGSKPYAISKNGTAFQEVNSFSFLSGGNYTMLIKDSKGCTSEPYTLTVSEKQCIPAAMDYVFSYQNSQDWVFPELSETDCVFYVYNSSGGLVYSVPLVNGSPVYWNGYGTNGQRLALGLYIFRFANAEQILLHGSITIVD